MSSEIEIYYKDELLDTMDESGAKTLLTAGKYCEDNIGILYTRPSGVDMLLFEFNYVDGKFVPSVPSADFTEAYANDTPIVAVTADAQIYVMYWYSPLRSALEYQIGYSYENGIKIDSYVYYDDEAEIVYSAVFVPASEE